MRIEAIDIIEAIETIDAIVIIEAIVEIEAIEMIDVIEIRENQICNLSEARDRLLPELMSGEIEV